jgi:Type I restriction modification DNA specificity domain.
MVNTENTIFAPSPLRWCSISTEKVRSNAYRLDASAYDIEAMEALSRVCHNPYGWVYLWSEKGLVEEAYYPGRYKRIYTSEGKGEPFYLPSQLEEIYPKPSKWISAKTASLLEKDRIEVGNLLISRSGTIGKCAISSGSSIGKIFSDDVIRITFKGAYDLGYAYAYLNTKEGLKLLQSNNYGAVIDHIEPEHLKNLPIPNASEEIKRSIHESVIASYDLRDQSNDLIDEAQRLLYEALGLPEKMDLKPKYYAPQAGFRCFTISSDELNKRFDVSYHLPEIKEVLSLISKQAAEVTTLGDPRISKEIILPGRFKRIYVEKEQGVPFFGGKQLLQLALPIKYIAKQSYSQNLQDEITITNTDILISARGTIGKSCLAYKHWAGSCISDNIIRLQCIKGFEGYVYTFISSELGQQLLQREISGAVVDVVEPVNVMNTPIPLLKDGAIQQRINVLVLQAYELRYQAYLKEQEALQQMEKVLKR